ncbi:MAG TPA: SDR family oxidoreductase [Ktedonobacterales bacterium]|nr:SDR family oxidoreductase [Ktedonobacterales bacterium]
MILIVGASGRLGGIVARRLLADGKPVRAMSRTPANLSELQRLGAEVVPGDQRDPQSLAAACNGIDTVFTASHAFNGKGDNDSRVVDDRGNRNLIDAARAAGVRLVVYTSILGARPNHPVDMYRYKYATEQYLRGSGLECTILRPAPFMETWLEILGNSVIKRGTAMVFGTGTNPINFVSVDDVASIAVRAIEDRQALGKIVEVGGPENMSQMHFVRAIQQATGRSVKIRHIPLPMMRIMRVATQRINPVFSRMTLAGIIMDTEDMTLDPANMLKLFPMHLTSLKEVVARRFSATSESQPVTPERAL